MKKITIHRDTRCVVISMEPEALSVLDNETRKVWAFTMDQVLVKLTDDQAKELYGELRSFFVDEEPII